MTADFSRRPRIPEQDVLAWVNKQRKKYGLNGPVGPKGKPLASLPAGRPGSAFHCVIARALDGETIGMHTCSNSSRWLRPSVRIRIGHPEFIQKFIIDFDMGFYPHLIDSP